MQKTSHSHPDILTSSNPTNLDIITKSVLTKKTVTPEQAHAAYPDLTLTFTPNTDTSLAAQVKRQFKNNTVHHMTGDIYRLTLSKKQGHITKYDIDDELKPLNLEPKQIQYVDQDTRGNVTINITVDKNTITKWIK